MNEEVLIVEDDMVAINLIKSKLDRAEYFVHVTKNGRAGLAHAIANPPKLIITDIMMPEMDGLSLFKELKKNPATCDIPIIVLTQKNDMRDAFIDFGADNFIGKPFGGIELLRKVKMSLRQPIKDPVQNKKILVAGNLRSDMEDIVCGFRTQGYYADYLLSGKDVIAEAKKYHYDVLLMDIVIDDIPPQKIIQDLKNDEDVDELLYLIFNIVTEEDQKLGVAHKKGAIFEQIVRESLECGAAGFINTLSQSRCIEQVEEHIKKDSGQI